MSTNRPLTVALAVALAVLGSTFVPLRAADPEPIKVTVQVRGAIGEGSVKVFRETLMKVEGIKFKPADILKGREPRFYSESFEVEITRPDKIDIGALGKAVAEAKTPLRDEIEPGLHLVLHSLNAVNERLIVKVRDSLADVEGLAVRERGGVGGSPVGMTIWVRIDDSGKAKLKTILNTLATAGIKVSLEREP